MSSSAAGWAESLAADIADRLTRLADRTTATVRRLRVDVSREIAGAAPGDVLALAERLIGDGRSDVRRFVAYELVAYHRGAMAALGVRDVERLGAGMASWPAVDTFSCYVAGPAWREGRLRDAAIARWARSPDRWWRRAALASTVALNCRARGGRGDPARTLTVCAMLVADREPMVWKALSWSLRELAKREPDAVRRFIAEHEAALGRPVLREVRTKLEIGRKAARRAKPRG